MECTVTSKKVGRAITVEYDFGTNVNNAIEKFGEESVFNHFVADAKLSVNSLVRPMLEKGLTVTGTGEDKEITGEAEFSNEKIHEIVAAYKLPDKTGRRVDPGQKAIDALKALSPEKQAEIMSILGLV